MQWKGGVRTCKNDRKGYKGVQGGRVISAVTVWTETRVVSVCTIVGLDGEAQNAALGCQSEEK